MTIKLEKILPAALLAISAWAASADAQTFQSSGTDFSPVNVGGKVATNAHNDALGTDTPNVRVSAYFFQTDPNDPNFTQDPGFNAPAGSGLPAGDTFSFDILDGLRYWNGSGPVQLATPPNSESLLYNFGTSNRTLTGSSGVQAGFNIGAITSSGALHKHLNAFLQDSTGSADPTAHPTAGIYVAQLRLNDSTLQSSDPIFAVYDNGLSQAQTDRAKFYIRNHFAPGSSLVQVSTSMIGLSAQPGEANLATGGQVVVTAGPHGYTSEINELTTNSNKGSVVINQIAPGSPVLAMLWLSGTSADVSSLISNLNIPDGYQIAPSTASAGNPLFADIQSLEGRYPGFSALVEFTPTTDNAAFTWDFSGNPNVTLDRFAAVPEPTTALFAFAGIPLLARRRHRRAI